VPKIAIQLYSVRGLLQKRFEETIREIAEMGYEGVETDGFAGTTPDAAAELFKEFGLSVTSLHYFPIPSDSCFNEVVEIAQKMGCDHIVSGFDADHFKTLDDIFRTCDIINENNALCQRNGLKLSIHNHWWEYLPLYDTYGYRILLEKTDTSVLFEIDTYWVKVAGYDPIHAVSEIGKRAPLLHLKDGPGEKRKPNLAVGYGIMDIPALRLAGNGMTEWWIVEFDRCATDILEAVKKSYQYLKNLRSKERI
jgi:sugar phosphate isomerase/epimerase